MVDWRSTRTAEYPTWAVKHGKPPNPATGDDTPDSLFSAVGRITHMWEAVENSLESLFALFAEAPTPGASQAYGAIAASSGRLKMIEAAGHWYIKRHSNPEGERELKAVLAMAKNLSSLRNIVAHGYVAFQTNTSKLTGPPGAQFHPAEIFVLHLGEVQETSYFLVPAFYNSNKTTKEREVINWYNTSTLIQIEQAMFSLKHQIDRLVFHVYGKRPLENILTRPVGYKPSENRTPKKTKSGKPKFAG